MPIIALFDGRSNSCTLGGYKISGLSVQGQGIGVTDDSGGVLRVILHAVHLHPLVVARTGAVVVFAVAQHLLNLKFQR